MAYSSSSPTLDCIATHLYTRTFVVSGALILGVFIARPRYDWRKICWLARKRLARNMVGTEVHGFALLSFSGSRQCFSFGIIIFFSFNRRHPLVSEFLNLFPFFFQPVSVLFQPFHTFDEQTENSMPSD